jgi:hypothetical protein
MFVAIDKAELVETYAHNFPEYASGAPSPLWNAASAHAIRVGRALLPPAWWSQGTHYIHSEFIDTPAFGAMNVNRWVVPLLPTRETRTAPKARLVGL